MDTIPIKKRVAVITKYFYPVTAGIENNIMQTYSVLADTFGWDVTIHTTADNYLAKNIYSKEASINSLKIKRYPSNWLGFAPALDWQNIDVVALHNFDVFFVRILLRALYLKLTGRKHFALLLTPHGGFSPEWSIFSPFNRFLKRNYTHTLGAWLINAVVDGVRAVSTWEFDEEVKYIKPGMVRVIDNGLENEAYGDIDLLASNAIKNKIKGYGRYIVQIGRVYPIKNFDTAINCLQFLPEDIKLVIVGPLQDEKYKQHLLNLVAQHNLGKRVFFEGVIRGTDKYYVMKHAIAMVHMALWESGCNVVREGMSQGLPGIVSNVYGLPGLVKNGVNGFCLPVADARGVADKILWIIDDVNMDKVNAMRQTNVIFGKGQSWGEVAKRMDNFYRESLNVVTLLRPVSGKFI